MHPFIHLDAGEIIKIGRLQNDSPKVLGEGCQQKVEKYGLLLFRGEGEGQRGTPSRRWRSVRVVVSEGSSQ